MAFIDYYKVMGIPKDTPQKDIRAAYRKRSKQFHPDLHPDDPKAKAKFQMLNEAYEVLNDPEKRAKYDQYGENWKQAEQFGGFGTGGGGGNPFEGFSFNMSGEGGMSDFFQLTLDKVQAQLMRQWGIEMGSLSRHTSAFFFLSLILDLSHQVHTVSNDDEDDSHILCK